MFKSTRIPSLVFAGLFASATALAAPFSPSTNLETLNGTDGFSLFNPNAGDNSGWSVSSAGDINGDGIDDLIIGAPLYDAGGNSNSGESYVVFGKTGPSAPSIDLVNLNGSDGFSLYNPNSGDNSGYSVSGAGDVNGDGIDDLIIGAPGYDAGASNSGESYVVYGSTNAFPSSIDLETLNGSDGFSLFNPNSGDNSGWSVSSAGDVNGDGYDDVIVGARNYDAGATDSGESYVVFGGAGGFPASINLESLNGSDGFSVYSPNAGDLSGNSVSSAGDLNGDGIDDIIVGAPLYDAGGNSNTGESYVVFGSTSSFPSSIDLETLNGSDGFSLYNPNAGDTSGFSVSAAGDINGDGIDDIIIGAPNYHAGASNTGESYVVFGSTSGFPPSIDLETLNGSDGFSLFNPNMGDKSGWSVSGAGDVNGDGIDDLIIGAPNYDAGGSNSGESYVFFGRESGFPSSINLETLNGSDGFSLFNPNSGDNNGRSVSDAGDVNGDGVGDVIIGAPKYDAGAADSGESYVFFGRSSGPSTVTRVNEVFDNNEKMFVEILDPLGLAGVGFDQWIVDTLDLSRLDPQNPTRNFQISIFSRGAIVGDIAPHTDALNFNPFQNFSLEILTFNSLIGAFEASSFDLLTAGFLNELFGGVFNLSLNLDDDFLPNGAGGLFLNYQAQVPVPGAVLLLLTGLIGLRFRNRIS